jgi:hypothetical protein
MRATLAAALVVAALIAVACGDSGGTPSATPAASPSTPVADASGGPSGSPADVPGPSPSHWPTDVIQAVLLLGKADLDIQQAGADLGAAAAYEDLQKMWGAADGLATSLDRLQSQVQVLHGYPETAALAASYDLAFPDMLAGAKELRDAITGGDANGVTAGSQQLASGLQKYSDTRALLGPLLEQAVLMQRLLLK